MSSASCRRGETKCRGSVRQVTVGSSTRKTIGWAADRRPTLPRRASPAHPFCKKGNIRELLPTPTPALRATPSARRGIQIESWYLFTEEISVAIFVIFDSLNSKSLSKTFFITIIAVAYLLIDLFF